MAHATSQSDREYMNTTVTTCAEKKAKQFLNLLQGYTKGIRLTAILMLLLMGVSNMSAANITSDGTARLYFKMSAVNWWIAGNNGDGNFAYFYGTSGSAWSAHSVKHSGNDYYVVIPAGTWDHVILTRNNTSTSPSWDNKWNQTGNIALSSSSNYLSNFSADSESATWGTAIKPTSTASVASSAANVFVGAPANLTASLTSNANINTIKSVAYSTTTGASITGNTFTATAEGTYTVTATVTYHPNGYPSLTSTATATTTITASVPAEETNEVSVTYMCDATEVSPAIAEIVGVETEKSFTAPTVTGYNFTGWTIGAGITLKAGSASDATITVVTKSKSSDYTLVANYEEVMETIYFINTGKWSVVNLHRWGGTATETSWPGEAMTSTGEKIGEYDVYSFTARQGAFANVIFTNKNTGSDQTGDLTWTAGKYYIYNYGGKSGWYTQSEAEELLIVIPDYYITGTIAGGWDGNEVKMTYSGDKWSHTFSASALTIGTEYKLKVTDGTWNNHWSTINGTIEGVSNDGDGNVCFKLSTVGDVTVTFDGAKITMSTTGAFKVPVTYKYYVVGSMNSWNQSSEDYGMSDDDEDGIYEKTLTLKNNDEFKVKGNDWYGFEAIEGKYKETSSKEGNIKLTLNADTEVTIKFNSETKKITFDGLTEDYYTVVGVADIFGEAWATNSDANKMVKQDDGSYKLVKENVTLAAIGYEWKIAKNGTWWYDAATGVNPSEGNNTLTITTAGRYNVTFTLSANLQTATAETELLEEIIVIPDCYISGNATLTGGEGWQGNEFTMVYDEETETWTYTLAGLQPEKEYELKVVCGGTWYSFENLVTPVPTGITEGNDHAIAFQMEEAGDVVVTYNKTNGITINGNFVKFINVYLAGDMTNWGEGQLQFRKKAADDKVATVTVELTEGEYKFKIIEGETWLGNNGTMTRQYHENWIFRAKQDDGTTDEVNATIDADENGIYTFTWNSTDNKLTVTYPAPTAKYIYFKNNPGWNKVYVYFFQEDNFNDKGAVSTGLTVANKRVAAMTRIENTDIWQYEYGTTGITPGNVIAFTEASQPNYSNFHNTKAVYRSDFNKKMELFIPQKTSNETKNGTKYYSKGVWMKYNATESGYSLDLTDEPNKPDFTTENVGGYVFSTTIRLNASKTYKFKIPNVKGDKFATSKSITFAQNNNDVEFTTDDKDDVNITTNTAGVYTFMIDLSSGKLKLSVDYPLADGDYRLAYKENYGTKNTKFHPAQYIRKVTEDTKLDIVSFYINKEGNNPAIVLQQATVDNAGNVKWNNVDSTLIDLSKIEQSGVYIVALQQTNEGSHQATILCNDETYPQPYTGNYYIRTDAANGGWGFYEQETNQMEYTNLNADYDYYYCKWFNNPTGNVRFVVANDYSECVSDTMTTDTFLDDGEKLLGESANVRFAWSSKTNTTSRAYLAGSGSNNEYLTISGTNIYTNAASPEPISGKSKFVDQNDWVYALDIKAKHGAVIDVIAKYKGKESTFIDDQNIMSTQAGDDKYYILRVIYNFKTNNMVSSWLLQNVEQNMALSADIMMIRNGQGSPNQLKLNGHSISGDPKTVYGVMQFDKSFITNSEKSIEERGLYWISFPFDVKLVDVFGLGEYGTAWIIQYYDGAERAQKGWFQETATFWKYVMPEERKNFVLKANVGYGLALDIEAIDWPNDIEQQNLYFPSAGKIETISTELTSTTVDVPAHTCTIERDDRKTKDSHWNVIGVPSYADAENVVSPDGLKFLYEWNAQENTLTVSNATTHTFKAMHSYMVQFAGTIDWEHKKIAPAALAAKAPAKESTLLQLTLTEGDMQLDQTYVELTDEATAAFDMNMDLTKFFNTGHANIYSCIQTVPVAANMLPVQSVQVPLGIQLVKEGSYTIALPASVDAALVTLIDNQTQTHTCLNTSDYTITLPAGTYENRFFLAVEPQRVVTSDPANKQDTAPTVKFIKDGQLYILHQGVIYDAQGRR